jgi:hypothetical protein
LWYPSYAARKDQGCRQRTAIRGIAYLLPDRSWRTWTITPGNAAEVARQPASLVHRDAEPYLHRLSSDPTEMLAAAKHSAIGVTGPCRVAVLLARHQGREEAAAFLNELTDSLRTRTDAVAEQERQMATRTCAWLAAD